jgi:cytoskeletal protein CcmA (bactofilin family)
MAFWKKQNESQTTGATETAKTSAIATSAASQSTAAVSNPVTTQFAAPQQAPVNKEDTQSPVGVIRTAIGLGTSIQGKLSFDSPVKIEGKVKGEIFSSKNLIVGKAAIVEAVVIAPSVTVLGQVLGEIRATERLEIKPEAIVAGVVFTPCLVVSEGSVFNAKVSMGLVAETQPSRQKLEKTSVQSGAERVPPLPPLTPSPEMKLPSGSQVH